VIASRSSATFLPEKSSPRAAAAALSPVCLAVFCAVCCRPRALPPAFAARLRAVLLPLDEDLLHAPDFRALDVERRVEEDDDDEPEALRLRPPDPPAVDFRAPEELDFRALDPPEDLRALDPLADLRALDPPELRELDARELDARELDEELLDLRALDPRALDPDAFRPPDPPPDLLRDEPPPLPELDSAICSSSSEALRRLPARRRRDYMPSAAVTYA
jgi:hypothetical protein